MDKNKELCELLGIEWHEPKWYSDRKMWNCTICGTWTHEIPACVKKNPDFTTPAGIVQLLGIMRGRDDWYKFAYEYLIFDYYDKREYFYALPIDYYLLDATGRLRDAAIEFLKITNK